MNDSTHKSCPQWREMLKLDPDHLPSAKQDALYEHIVSCPMCSAILNDSKISERVRRALAIERVPDLLPQLSSGRERRSRRAGWYQPLLLARGLSILFASIHPIVQIIGSVILTGLLVFGFRQVIFPDLVANAAEAAALSLAMGAGMLLIRQARNPQTRRNGPSGLALTTSSLPASNDQSLKAQQHSRRATLATLYPKASHEGPSLPGAGRQKYWTFPMVTLIMILAIGASSLSGLLHPTSIPATNKMTTPIGLSYGTIVFDLNRPDRDAKLQAAARLAAKDIRGAITLWQQAVMQDSGDAEAQIYLEDQQVLASGRPYFTLVIGTILSNDYMSGGRDDLQAAYVAQKDYNNTQARSNAKPLLRLLLAIAHSDPTSVTTVAQQVVDTAQKDTTIKGVVGWPTSSSAYAAISVLDAAHLPMISPTASSDILTGISSYMFRISPTNKFQEQAAAIYARQVLHAKRVAVIYDASDTYSASLANDFTLSFQDAEHKVVVQQKYIIGNGAQLTASTDIALAQHPDLIFVASYAHDVGQVLNRLPSCDIYCPLVLGGDALYLQGDYASAQPFANANRLRITSFAHPDLWQVQNRPKPTFFSHYTLYFDPYGKHPADTYGYEQPEAHTILAYDAISVLLSSVDTLLAEGKNSFRPEEVQAELARIGSTHPFPGINWDIAFARGDDTSGQVVVMKGSQDGKFNPVWLWMTEGKAISLGPDLP